VILLPEQPELTEKADILFENWYLWTLNGLESISKLLGKNNESHIFQLLKKSKELFYKGEKEGPIHLGELTGLLEDLVWLENKNPEEFREIGQTLFKARDYGDLCGKWFELKTINKLLELGIEYSRPEPPDFKIYSNNHLIYIECYAPRIQKWSKLVPSIRKIFNEKDKKYKDKQWTQKRAILFLDLTPFFEKIGLDQISGQNFIPENIKNLIIRESKKVALFDVIACFYYGRSNQNDRTVSCFYMPKNISDEPLDLFINKFLSTFNEENNSLIQLSKMPK
jgi:hypothetical protein